MTEFEDIVNQQRMARQEAADKARAEAIRDAEKTAEKTEFATYVAADARRVARAMGSQATRAPRYDAVPYDSYRIAAQEANERIKTPSGGMDGRISSRKSNRAFNKRQSFLEDRLTDELFPVWDLGSSHYYDVGRNEDLTRITLFHLLGETGLVFGSKGIRPEATTDATDFESSVLKVVPIELPTVPNQDALIAIRLGLGNLVLDNELEL